MAGGLSGILIYKNFKNGIGTGPIQEFADQLTSLKATYEQRAESIRSIQSEMESAWTGDAGAVASAGAGPLKPALFESATNMDKTFQSAALQTAAWHDAANSVEPVPPVPEKPSPWGVITDPAGGVKDLMAYDEAVEQHNRAAQHNVDVMSSYESRTHANSDFPRNYRTLTPSGASVSIDTTAPSAVSGDVMSIPDTTRGPGVAPGTGGTGVPMPGSGSEAGPVPTVNGPSSAGGRPGPATSGMPGGNGSPVTPPAASTGTGGGFFGGAVGAAGGGDDATRRGTGLPGDRNSTGGTAPRTGGGFGERAGSRLYGAGAAGASGLAGSSQGAAGRVAGDAARGGKLGAPGGTGAGVPGGAGMAGDATAKSAVSSTSGRAAGMAPVGAGAGKGDEDAEHQRAPYLQENDPDEVFLGDLGKTAPPVIGE